MLPRKESFELYVDDDRYSAPTLHLIFAWNRASALEIADGLLKEGEHHLGVELRQGGVKLAGLGSFATAPRAAATRMTLGGGA